LILSPAVLEWAANQIGSSLSSLAIRISKRNHADIEAGKLTTAQALKFSTVTHVPFGYLFNKTPPQPPKLPIADFRTITNKSRHQLSQNFFDVYHDASAKQDWYRDYLRNRHAAPLKFVGKLSPTKDNVKKCARQITEILKVSQSDFSKHRRDDDLYSVLSAKAEDAGILVLKSGIVGSNTHRKLSYEEFRGFVLVDKYAPLIFVNGTDFPASNTFTLIHEIAHIFFGQSAISDATPFTKSREEAICNAVAAEFLVPENKFIKRWASISGDDSEKVSELSREFSVSMLAIARRALDFKFINEDTYLHFHKVAEDRAKTKAPGKGNSHYTMPIRNSKRLTELVSSLAVSGEIGIKEAGHLLNANPNFVINYYAKKHQISL
jgi:Zn-dependent peptidase ImmA (M78 family)